MHGLWRSICHSECPLGNAIRNSKWMRWYNQSWKKQSPYFRAPIISRSLQKNLFLPPCGTQAVYWITKIQWLIGNWWKKYCWKDLWNLVLNQSKPPKIRTGKSIASNGSGPAGLAAAINWIKQLTSEVYNFWKKTLKPGGLLRLMGFPDLQIKRNGSIDR